MSAVKGTVYLGVSRVLALILNLWAFGRYVSWLGDELWGAIALLLVFSTMVSALCDLGMGNGAINAHVGAFRDKDTQRSDRVLASHSIMSLALTSAASLVFIALYFLQFIKGVGSDLPGVLFYLCASIAVIQVFLINGHNSVLVAKGEYIFISYVALAAAMINTVVSLSLVYSTRQPWGFMAGNVISSLFVLLIYERKVRTYGLRKVPFRFYAEEFAPVKLFVKRAWIGNTAQLFAGLDKVVLKSVIGQASLGVYDQAIKIPTTLSSTMPLAQVFPAEVARAGLDGPEALLRTYWRVMPTTLALMLAIMFIPSAFATQILGMFLDKVTPEMAVVFAFASADAAFSVYGSMFAIFANGVNKPHVVTPYIWAMLLACAALSYPGAIYFGIIGVAGVRVGLQLLQFFFIERTIKRHLIPALDLKRAIVRKLIVLFTGLFFWAGGAWIVHQLQATWHPLALLIFPVVLAYTFIALLVSMRIIVMPQKLERLLPKFRRA